MRKCINLQAVQGSHGYIHSPIVVGIFDIGGKAGFFFQFAAMNLSHQADYKKSQYKEDSNVTVGNASTKN
jgi:hypothetical protein